MLNLYIQPRPPSRVRVFLGSVVTAGSKARFQEGVSNRRTHQPKFWSSL